MTTKSLIYFPALAMDCRLCERRRAVAILNEMSSPGPEAGADLQEIAGDLGVEIVSTQAAGTAIAVCLECAIEAVKSWQPVNLVAQPGNVAQVATRRPLRPTVRAGDIATLWGPV